MKIEGYKSGEYQKEIGIRLTNNFRSYTLVIGFWKYLFRFEWSKK